MQTALLIIEIVLALLLVLAILIQEKGSGFGEAIGGVGGSSFETTKRGPEGVLATLTVILMVLFLTQR